MPIDPVSPSTRIVTPAQRRSGAPACWRAHSFDDPLRAQESKQRQERQAEDSEIVAFDPFEQLDAASLDLVSAHALQGIRSDRREVAADGGRFEPPYGEARRVR